MIVRSVLSFFFFFLLIFPTPLNLLGPKLKEYRLFARVLHRPLEQYAPYNSGLACFVSASSFCQCQLKVRYFDG